MTGFSVFLKKEFMELRRSGRLLVLGIFFILAGILNPATAKLLPLLLQAASESMETSGIIIADIEVTALHAWEQFFKNISMELTVFVILFGGIFSREYNTGTLIPLLTKGLSKTAVTAAKAVTILLCWTMGYWLCFCITYAYTAYFWDNSITKDLMPAVLFCWICGIWVCSALILFASLTRSSAAALLCTGGAYGTSVLVSMFPKCRDLVPSRLMNGMSLLTGTEKPGDYGTAAVTAAVMVLLFLALAVWGSRRKI